MTLEQWITALGLAASFIVWFVGRKWIRCRSNRKMWADLTEVAIPIGLLILSLVVFEYDRTNTLQREVRLQREEAARVETRLRESKHYETISSNHEFVAVITKEVNLTRSRWLITRMQPLQASTQKELPYFESMVAKVASGEITDCRRIVRIPESEHLDLHVNLLERMGKSASFGLAIWKARETPVDFELLVGDNVVIFAFGNGAPTSGYVIHDKAIADKYAKTFEEWWRQSEIIKDKQAVSNNAEHSEMIRRMKSLMHKREKAAMP